MTYALSYSKINIDNNPGMYINPRNTLVYKLIDQFLETNWPFEEFEKMRPTEFDGPFYRLLNAQVSFSLRNRISRCP